MENNNLIAKLVDKISILEDRIHTVITESSSIIIETQSKELDKLGPLLPIVQSEIGNIGKNRTNTHFNSKYADLDSILSSVFPIINKHGLFLYFEVILWNRKKILRTKLIHGESLQWIGTLATLPQEGVSSQEYGKAETYQKKYSVRNILGITTADDVDDDDGESERKNTFKNNSGVISSAQLSKLMEFTSADEKARQEICDTLKISDITYIKKSDFASALTFIKKRIEER